MIFRNLKNKIYNVNMRLDRERCFSHLILFFYLLVTFNDISATVPFVFVRSIFTDVLDPSSYHTII